MEFKTLDNKLKEIYFNPTILNTDNITDKNSVFWNNMNIIASQNLAFLQMKLV